MFSSLSGLGDCAVAAIKALRDRLAKGEIQFSGDAAGDVEAMIAKSRATRDAHLE